MPKRPVDLEIAHRLLGGGPVALLATRYRERANVMALSWMTPISMNPPMVAVAVHRACLSHDFIERTGEFSLSIPGRALMEQVRDAGLTSGHDVDDKFEEVGLEAISGEALSVPLVEGCLGYLECSVVEAYEAGEEHTLFLAEVVGAQAEEEAFDEIWLLGDTEVKPLHHLGGHTYSQLSEAISAEPRPKE